MKTVLIYNDGDEFDNSVDVKEFDSTEKMIAFVNEFKLGDKILASYEVLKEIKLKPVSVVTEWEVAPY